MAKLRASWGLVFGLSLSMVASHIAHAEEESCEARVEKSFGSDELKPKTYDPDAYSRVCRSSKVKAKPELFGPCFLTGSKHAGAQGWIENFCTHPSSDTLTNPADVFKCVNDYISTRKQDAPYTKNPLIPPCRTPKLRNALAEIIKCERAVPEIAVQGMNSLACRDEEVRARVETSPKEIERCFKVGQTLLPSLKEMSLKPNPPFPFKEFEGAKPFLFSWLNSCVTNPYFVDANPVEQKKNIIKTYMCGIQLFSIFKEDSLDFLRDVCEKPGLWGKEGAIKECGIKAFYKAGKKDSLQLPDYVAQCMLQSGLEPSVELHTAGSDFDGTSKKYEETGGEQPAKESSKAGAAH